MLAAPPVLWLENCNITGSKGIGLSTKKLLEKEGAVERLALKPAISLGTHPNRFLNSAPINDADSDAKKSKQEKKKCMVM